GAEAQELASADLEGQVVAMRPHRGEPARGIPFAGGAEHRVPGLPLGQLGPPPVAEGAFQRFAQPCQLAAESGAPLGGPSGAHPDYDCAGIRQRTVKRLRQLRPPHAERRIALGQRRAVPGERLQVRPAGQGEHPVQILPPLSRAACRERHVSRQKRDREPAADRVCDPRRIASVQRNPLPPQFGGPGGRYRPPSRSGIEIGRDVKPAPAEPGDLPVRRSPDRAEEHRVIDGFEEVGLPLAVGAEQCHAPSGQLQVEVLQVPEAPCHQPLEPHYSMTIRRDAVSPRRPSRSVPKTSTVTATPERLAVEIGTEKRTVSSNSVGTWGWNWSGTPNSSKYTVSTPSRSTTRPATLNWGPAGTVTSGASGKSMDASGPVFSVSGSVPIRARSTQPIPATASPSATRSCFQSGACGLLRAVAGIPVK